MPWFLHTNLKDSFLFLYLCRAWKKISSYLGSLWVWQYCSQYCCNLFMRTNIMQSYWHSHIASTKRKAINHNLPTSTSRQRVVPFVILLLGTTLALKFFSINFSLTTSLSPIFGQQLAKLFLFRGVCMHYAALLFYILNF